MIRAGIKRIELGLYSGMAGYFRLSPLFLLLFCSHSHAGTVGTAVKAKASDYPVHQSAGKAEIGAEYMIRSITDGKNWYLAGDYLVVEVAIFPASGQTLNVSSSAFTLRIDGKKRELAAEAPGMVAASIKDPDWELKPRLDAEAAVGPVIVGRRPQAGERFPGDPRPGQRRLPEPPTVPVNMPGGVEREEAPRAYDVAVSAALPEGETGQPVGGYLYFRWTRKPKSIKSLELLYRGPDETVTVLPLIDPR